MKIFMNMLKIYLVIMHLLILLRKDFKELG